MNKTVESICVHSGLLFAVLLGLGLFGIAGWLPLHDPSWSASQIAQIFQEDHLRIQIGISVLAFGTIFYLPFAAAISTQMRRVEGEHHPLSSIEMASAAVVVVGLLLPCYVWLAITFRGDVTPPAAIQILNDFAWICFVAFYQPAFIESIAIGICILSDKGEKKIFPRWLGFANFGAAIGYTPGVAVAFVRQGPFAWNGVFGFWIPALIFFGWVILMWWACVRAIGAYHRSDDTEMTAPTSSGR